MADELTAGLDESIEDARRHRMDEDYARLVVTIVRSAARAEPERMREALESVFGLDSLLEIARKANARAMAAMQKCDDAERKLRGLESAIDDAAFRLDRIHAKMDDFSARMGKAKGFLEWLRNEARHLKNRGTCEQKGKR